MLDGANPELALRCGGISGIISPGPQRILEREVCVSHPLLVAGHHRMGRTQPRLLVGGKAWSPRASACYDTTTGSSHHRSRVMPTRSSTFAQPVEQTRSRGRRTFAQIRCRVTKSGAARVTFAQVGPARRRRPGISRRTGGRPYAVGHTPGSKAILAKARPSRHSLRGVAAPSAAAGMTKARCRAMLGVRPN